MTVIEISDLWTRFHQLADSVIRGVEIRTEPRPWSVIVELDSSSEGSWHRVRFEFTDVREWRFEQTVSDMLVVFEARVERIEELVCVSFDAATMPQAPTLADFRRTDAYVAAASVEASLRPLSG